MDAIQKQCRWQELRSVDYRVINVFIKYACKYRETIEKIAKLKGKMVILWYCADKQLLFH